MLLAATAALALGAVAWVPLTSAAMVLTPAGRNLRGASLGQVLPASYIYWRDHSANPAVAAWLPKSAAAAGLLSLAPAGLVLCLPSARRRQLRKLGVAEIAPPPVRGFGSRLIEDTLTYELGGEVQLSFGTQGVECRFMLPLSGRLGAA